MQMKRVSRGITEAIQKNIKPISNMNLLKNKRVLITEKSNNNGGLNDKYDKTLTKNLKIQEQYLAIKQNCNIDHLTNVKIISCLKLAEYTWKEYLSITNKNGQTSAFYLQKLNNINVHFWQSIDSMLVTGSLQEVKRCRNFLQPMISMLQQKSRKFHEHQNKFKVLNKAIEENKKQQMEQQEQIKQQMIGLVQQFKKYAVNIQGDLIKDAPIIEQIGKSQDSIENSLKNKSQTMKTIINEQKIGFIKLIIMGIIAALMWLFGLIVVIIT